MNVRKYAQEVVTQGRRVRWPKKDVMIPAIVVVISIAAFVAIFLSLEDLAVGEILKQLKAAFEGLK